MNSSPTSNKPSRSSPIIKNRRHYHDGKTSLSSPSSPSTPLLLSPFSSFSINNTINSTNNSPLTSFIINQSYTTPNDKPNIDDQTKNTIDNSIDTNAYIDPNLLPPKTKRMLKTLQSNLPERYLDTSQSIYVIRILSEQNYWSDEDETDDLVRLDNANKYTHQLTSLSTPKSNTKKSKAQMIKPKSLADTDTSINTQLCYKMREDTRKKKIENAVLIMLRKKMEKIGLQKKAKAQEMLAMLNLSFSLSSKIARIRVRDIIKVAFKKIILIEKEKREQEIHLHNMLIHYKNKLIGAWRKYRGRCFASAAFAYFNEYRRQEQEKRLREERDYRIRAAKRRVDEDRNTKEIIKKVYDYNQANKNSDNYNTNSYYYNTDDTKFFRKQAKTKYPLPRSVAVLRHDEGIETFEGYVRLQNQISAWEKNVKKTTTWEDFAAVDKKAIIKSQEGESCAMRLVRQWMDKHDKKNIHNDEDIKSDKANIDTNININDTTIVLVQQPVILLPTIIDETILYNDHT